MQKLLWATAALALSLTAAQAQTDKSATMGAPSTQQVAPEPDGKMVRDPQARANRLADRLTKRFNLNPGQREQVYGAFINQFQQIDQLRQQGQAKGQAKAIREQTDAKLKDILGADNYAKYQAEREEKHDRRKGNK